MANLLSMSEAIIEGGASVDGVGPINRVNHQLFEIGDRLAVVEAFSHCILFQTDDGLLAFDTSGPPCGGRVVEAVRSWRSDRFNTLWSTRTATSTTSATAFARRSTSAGATRRLR